MEEQIVDRFAPIIAHVIARAECAFGFDFKTAPMESKPERIAILRCDSDDLTLVSIMRKWWVIENNGVRTADKWVLPKGEFDHTFQLRCPTLKYSTDSSRIRFGLNLGPGWYGVRECDLASFLSGDFNGIVTISQTPHNAT